MSTEANKNVIRRWVEEGWNKANVALIDEIYTPDVVQHDPNSPAPVTSSEALKMYVSTFCTALPDLRFTIDHLIAEGDKVVWRFTAHGTQNGPLMDIPPSGKIGHVTGIVIFRFVGEKIAEVWVNFDALGLMQQLDVIPVLA